MSESLSTRRPLQTVSSENRPLDIAAPVEHPSERKTRLDELVENGKQRRWKEKTFIEAFLAFGFLISVVWAIVVLSGRFSPAEQQQVTDVIKGMICAVAGFIAGKGADKWFGS